MRVKDFGGRAIDLQPNSMFILQHCPLALEREDDKEKAIAALKNRLDFDYRASPLQTRGSHNGLMLVGSLFCLGFTIDFDLIDGIVSRQRKLGGQ
jgi:hypothetical protein